MTQKQQEEFLMSLPFSDLQLRDGNTMTRDGKYKLKKYPYWFGFEVLYNVMVQKVALIAISEIGESSSDNNILEAFIAEVINNLDGTVYINGMVSNYDSNTMSIEWMTDKQGLQGNQRQNTIDTLDIDDAETIALRVTKGTHSDKYVLKIPTFLRGASAYNNNGHFEYQFTLQDGQFRSNNYFKDISAIIYIEFTLNDGSKVIEQKQGSVLELNAGEWYLVFDTQKSSSVFSSSKVLKIREFIEEGELAYTVDTVQNFML